MGDNNERKAKEKEREGGRKAKREKEVSGTQKTDKETRENTML